MAKTIKRKRRGKGGRQTKYTPALAQEICLRMAAGESLRSICRDAHMPQHPTVLSWVLSDYEGFASQYAHAREALAMHWAEDLLEIADEDPLFDADGKVDSGSVAHARVRIDTRKWLLSRVLPKIYGDSLDVKHKAQAGFSVKIEGLE